MDFPGITLSPRRVASAVCAVAAFACPLGVEAACSLYAGKVAFNEVYDPPGTGAPFVELKVLDPSVVSATSNFQNWKIDVYAGNNATKAQVDFSSGVSNIQVNSCGQTSLWVNFSDASLDHFLSTYDPPFNFVLYDSSSGGRIVDILRLGDDVTSFYGSGTTYTKCSMIENALPAIGSGDTLYDAQQGAGSSTKDWYRVPDGTGRWGGRGTSDVNNTSCSSDTAVGGGTFGIAKTASTTVVPVNTEFTYTLYAINGSHAMTSPASVAVTDDLNAAGLAFVSCTTAQGSCTHSGGVVTWTVTASGGMSANVSYNATLTVRSATVGDKTNVITSNVGSPAVTANAPVVKVTAPPLDYRMDDATWSNGATIIDSGANGADGTLVRLGTASRVTGKICGAPNLNLTIGDGVWIGNTTAMDISNGGSIAFWIKPSDATNRYLFAKGTDYFAYLDGSGKLAFGWGTNGLEAGLKARVTSSAAIPANAWTHAMLVFDKATLTASIYLNGSLDASAAAVVPTIGSSSLGIGSLDWGNWIVYDLLTGRNGYAGIIDEFAVFTAPLTAPQIFSFYNNEAAGLNYDGTPRICAGVVPDHVEFVHDGAALTCTPKPVVVNACTTSADCSGGSNQFTSGSFSVSPSAIAGATWCSDAACASVLPSPATLTNGQTIYLKDTNVRTDRIGGTAGAANPTVQCSNTSVAGSFNATTACDLAFAASGFLLALPHHVSCTDATLEIKAVKTDDATRKCVPAFANTTRPETIAFGYSDPASGTVQPKVAGTAISTSGTPVTLSFDATGTATPTFNYADVGKLAVTVSDASLPMTGSAAPLPVVAPAGFAFSGVTSGPIGAGKPFSATVTAMNGCATPAATPNFGREATPESVVLTPTRVAPSGAEDSTNGPRTGGLGGGTGLTWLNGAATAGNLSYSEVGQIALNATLSSGNYLGSGLSAAGTSATIGDFVPAYFDTKVTQGCDSGGFTYSRQPFTVEVTARNAASDITLNYSNFPGCAACAKDVTLSDPTATARFNGTNTIAATAFAKGVGSRDTIVYTLPTAATSATDITLRAGDGAATSEASVLTYPTHVEGSANIRSGRLRLINAYGSELLAMWLPVRSEYFKDGSWRVNAQDSCTAIANPRAQLALGNCTGTLSCAGASPNMGSSHLPTTSVTLHNGQAAIPITAPNCAAPPCPSGAMDLALNLAGSGSGGNDLSCVAWGTQPASASANLAWLQYDWCAGKRDPSARARFGATRTPYIYLRERY